MLSQSELQDKLKIRHLTLFEAVCEQGSILKASRSVGLSQPTVSKTIREMEGVLGSALFRRTNRGVELTVFGTHVSVHTKRLLSHLRFMSDDLNTLQDASRGHVTVGTLISASAKLLPRSIIRLKQQSPNVIVTIREGSNEILMPALANGELDIVVGRIPDGPSYPGVIHQPLYTESICAVVGTHHALATAAEVRLGDVQASPWILPLADSQVRGAVEEIFAASQVDLPTDVVESFSILNNIAMLIESETIAVMPRAAADYYVAAGLLCILPLEGTGRFGQVGLTTSESYELSPAAQRMEQCLIEVAAQL
ncbi:MAG: LysR substrate-binding domain-containing protein [Acidimicrobiales bacterium]